MPDSETPERCPTCADAVAELRRKARVNPSRWEACSPVADALEALCPDPFHPDPLPIPSSDQERCGGTGQISEWRDDPRGPAFNDSPDSTAGGGIMPCPGCPDCRDPFHARADVGGEGNASASPVGSGGGRSVHNLAADVSPPSTDQEGERWTAHLCECGCLWRGYNDKYCPGCRKAYRYRDIEVVPASLLDAAETDRDQQRRIQDELMAQRDEALDQRDSLREGLERFVTWPCAKFPKEQQPHRFNCLLIRADHRENAADYTDESNAEAEQLCDPCVARSLLHLPSEPDSAEAGQG